MRWALLILVLACDGALLEETRPVEAVEAVAEVEPELEPTPFVEHTVQTGQTLWDIARAYEGVSVDDILAFNDMTDRQVRRLRNGSVLRIPGVTEHETVERVEPVDVDALPPLEDAAYHVLGHGETLWDVAQTYEQSVEELMARNELDEEGVRALRPGQPLIVPGIDQSDVRVAEPSTSNGFRHTVRAGETIWDLARSFRVSVAALMAANRLSPTEAENLREGARLYVPGGERRRENAPRLTARQRRAQNVAQRLGLGTRQAATRLLQGRPEARWVRAARGRSNRTPGTLRWPVTNGRFVRGYGSGEGGYHLAVDIAGDMGWNVRAAAAGIVGYSGDGVPGYGNLVLVVHSGGWVTMYAHNSVNFVVAGEQVPAGAVLAELGSTGISRGPHVHFEFMVDGKNCDPARLFRPGVRHASRLARIPQATWSDADEIPDGVSCARRRRHPRSRWVVNE